MMRFGFLILFCLQLFPIISLGQSPLEIQGTIVSAESNEALPYVHVFNQSTKKGTISNLEGYFKIPISSYNDTIKVSFTGFKEQIIELKSTEKQYKIRLEENVLMINEIFVSPNDNYFLYALVQDCNKQKNKRIDESKAYFELKSFIDSNQVELLECYYNTKIQGYHLQDLKIKKGRLALQRNENHLFISKESSQAILMLDIFKKSAYFPSNPLEFSMAKLRKYFYLTLENKYLENNSDSVYIINYTPKDTNGTFFYGKIWLNKTKNQISKISLECENAKSFPFLPLFSLDSISKVDLAITQTFNEHGRFNHIDFNYSVAYNSRSNQEKDHLSFTIHTNAILYAYDIGEKFDFPIFDFSENSTGDYRNINAIPYNEFFWKNNSEYKLNESDEQNEQFFSNPNSLSNKVVFKKLENFRYGIFEHPYVTWTTNRIQFREMSMDTTINNARQPSIKSEQYHFSVKTYLDYNKFGDSTQIYSAVVFDPYESYYHLPIDRQTLCFINVYFDLCEIERRKLEAKLISEKSNATEIQALYKEYEIGLDLLLNKYLKAVDRGTRQIEMMRYNTIVFNQLGIDNIALFDPFPEDKSFEK